MRKLIALLLMGGGLCAQVVTINSSDNGAVSLGKINGNFALLAPKASPTFTGTMTLTGFGSGVMKSTLGVFGLVSGTSTFCVHVDGSSAACTAGAVTSVGMTGDGVIYNASVTGSPITSTGTLVPSLKTQTANFILAGPTTGGAATPTFRALVAADMPVTGPGSGTVINIVTTAPITGGPITATGTLACPTCITASSPGAGLLHLPGSSQNGTSSSVVSADLNITPTACTNQLVSAIGSGGIGTCHTIVQADLPANTKTRALPFSIGDPGGSALTVASTTTEYLTVPFACTISAYNLVVNGGTVTVKFWKIATGTAIPTAANSINTSGVGISTGTAIHSATLSDFTSTTVTANDILAMNVTAVATATYVQGVLECTQ